MLKNSSKQIRSKQIRSKRISSKEFVAVEVLELLATERWVLDIKFNRVIDWIRGGEGSVICILGPSVPGHRGGSLYRRIGKEGTFKREFGKIVETLET